MKASYRMLIHNSGSSCISKAGIIIWTFESHDISILDAETQTKYSISMAGMVVSKSEIDDISTLDSVIPNEL
jgi:hypothetical protein